MEHIIRYIGEVYVRSAFRGKDGPRMLESRIRQAASEAVPTRFLERVGQLMQSDPVDADVVAPALSMTQGQLAWVRGHHKITASLALLSARSPSSLSVAIQSIGELAEPVIGDRVVAAPVYDIAIRAVLQTPLAHGGDENAGNATLFRRKQVLADNGGLVSLPYYAGNAWRGQMRDLLADDFTALLGFAPSRTTPPWAPWFFHCLYAGGSLTDLDKTTRKGVGERANATVVLQQRHLFREMVPMLSVLGVAIGNTLLAGKIDTGDLEPECAETGVGEHRAHELLTWEFLTRRDDQDYEREKHEGMIASHEVMMAGAALVGGVDLRPNIMDHERALVGRGLRLLRERGKLGGSNRRGWGQVALEFDAPDDAPYVEYVEYVESRKDEILAYLSELQAVATDAGS